MGARAPAAALRPEYDPPMPRPLAIGVQLPEIEREVRWPELRTLIETIEDVGFDSIWVGDHLLYRLEDGGAAGPWEAWSQLAAIAAITDRVTLGPLVAATSFHAPAMLAKKAATVDEISGGRLILGLGAGWNEAEYAAFGFPFDHRVSRFEEAFTIIRTLLSVGHVDFSGRYYHVRDCELLPRPRPGGPPLMVGSQGPRMLAATLPHVAMWNAWHSWFGNTPAGLAPMLAQVDTACLEAGRMPGEVAHTITVMVEMTGGSGGQHGSPGRPTSMALSGTPEHLAAEFRRYADLGVAHIQLVVDPITAAAVEELGEVLAILDASR